MERLVERKENEKQIDSHAILSECLVSENNYFRQISFGRVRACNVYSMIYSIAYNLLIFLV